jgi:hypothetical protein
VSPLSLPPLHTTPDTGEYQYPAIRRLAEHGSVVRLAHI